MHSWQAAVSWKLRLFGLCNVGATDVRDSIKRIFGK